MNRLERSLSVFQRTWGVSAGIVGAIEATPVSASWVVEASGPNWSTRTSYEMLRWDDLILED
ncbi:MAG TPA: hypothetical protein PLX43_08325, partial [Nitrobacter sp.]|nr:hypothetical protein [Nitrobacter sp.]